MRSTFKTLFYLKKNSPKPDGTVSLMGRITIDGTISQFSCKMTVQPNLWDTKAGRVTGKSTLAIKTNLALDKIRVDINRHYQEVMQTDGFVTADKVKNAYLGLGVKQDTFLALFDKHNQEFSRKVPKRIIEKYRGYTKDNRVFPVPSNTTCNKILKKIAKQCGIKTRLSYHVARHTFGTLLTISQGVPIETVSRMMGHTNIKTTQIYAKITKEKISQDMEILSHKLESFEKQITERI